MLLYRMVRSCRHAWHSLFVDGACSSEKIAVQTVRMGGRVFRRAMFTTELQPALAGRFSVAMIYFHQSYDVQQYGYTAWQYVYDRYYRYRYYLIMSIFSMIYGTSRYYHINTAYR